MTPPAWLPDPIPEMVVPPHWRRIDFISDLHLDATCAETIRCFLAQVQASAEQADALLILGDLFDAWPGDDVLSDSGETLPRIVAQALRAASEHIEVHLMCGNRDFLLGHDYLRACGAKRLADPTVLAASTLRCLLTHGDALCLDDTAYQAFRQRVRDPAWRAATLARPLADRLALARELRSRSESEKSMRALDDMDVDRAAAIEGLRLARASLLVHGHTHRPADESWGDGLGRIVLSDWDLDGTRPHAQLLSLQRADEKWSWLRQDRSPSTRLGA